MVVFAPGFMLASQVVGSRRRLAAARGGADGREKRTLRAKENDDGENHRPEREPGVKGARVSCVDPKKTLPGK